MKTTTGVSVFASSTASNHRICSSSMCTCGTSRRTTVVGGCQMSHMGWLQRHSMRRSLTAAQMC